MSELVCCSSGSFAIVSLEEVSHLRDEAMAIFHASFPANEVEDLQVSRSGLPRSWSLGEWVLRFAETTVGYLAVVFSDVSCAPRIAYFFYLAVAEEWRGRGFGSRVMDFLKERFASYIILFGVESPDEDAPNNAQRVARIRMYERNGFCMSGLCRVVEGVSYSFMCRKETTPEEYEVIRAFLESVDVGAE